MDAILAILPVYLDHVCRPTLTAEHFATEVFHIDSSSGKKSGVVYSEMTGRALSESDLLDIHLRRLLYGEGSALALECGGKPFEIEKLAIQNIKAYHDYYYHPSRLSVLIIGPTEDPTPIFNCIGTYLSSTAFRPLSKPTVPIPPLISPSEIPSRQQVTIQGFPSSDDAVGSVAIGFRGPPLSDLKTLVALNVLFRALCETSASPLYQAFVECNPPIANSIDYDIKFYLQTSIALVFSGIENGAATSEDYMSGDESDVGGEDDMPNKLSADYIGGLLQDTFEHLYLAEAEFSRLIEKALVRHKEKFLESLEEDASDIIYSSYLWDVMLARHLESDAGILELGKSLHLLPIFTQLQNEPPAYWMSLFKNYCLDTSHWKTVVMVPQKNFFELNPDLVFDTVREATIVEADRNPPPLSLVSSFPDMREEPFDVKLPPANAFFHSICPFPFDVRLVPGSMPIEKLQFLTTETNLVNFYFCIDISSLPPDYFPYLVLFQELLFQSPIKADAATSTTAAIPYQKVVEFINQTFLSLEAAVGFGNSTFSCSYLSNVFVICGTCSCPEKFIEGIHFLSKILRGDVVFDADRLIVIAQNLFTELTEGLRDGQEVLSAFSTRSFIKRLSSSANNSASLLAFSRIDQAISSLNQADFLKCIIEEYHEKASSSALTTYLDNLSQLLAMLWTQPVIIQVGTSSDRIEEYDQLIRQHLSFGSVPSNRLGFIGFDSMKAVSVLPKTCSEPTIIGVGGLTTTHFSITIACDACLVSHDDKRPLSRHHFAVSLLCQLFSRTEGPFYELIRGKGLAYDAALHYAPWNRQLELFFFDCIDPKTALENILDLFRDIAKNLDASSCPTIFSQDALDSARSTYLYTAYSHKSTPSSLLSYVRQGFFKGLLTKEQLLAAEDLIFTISIDDLCQTFSTYISPFLDPSACDFVLVCEPCKVSHWQSLFSHTIAFQEDFLPLLD
jgi:Zn-dependent M16 (insulinase) family peptidase